MCIVIIHDKGANKGEPLTREQFMDTGRQFSYGLVAGIMWPDAHKKKVEILKGTGAENAEKLYDRYAELVKKKKPVIIQFRGHDANDRLNAQPFTAWNEKLGYALNGSCSYDRDPSYRKAIKNPAPSDAAAFGVSVLDQLRTRSMDSPAFAFFTGRLVTGLMAFIDYKGNIRRTLVGSWLRRNGVIYSARPVSVFGGYIYGAYDEHI